MTAFWLIGILAALGKPLALREAVSGAPLPVWLEISERTVQFHLDAVRTKLGAANRQEAVAIGMQLGLVTARM